ncbi:MAG: translation initiation factor [Kiritimatiellia bacterium]
MNVESNSRLVWSSEAGGRVGGSKEKTGKKAKKNKTGDLGRQGFPKDGVIRVCREKSGRGGKTVTVLYGVPGSAADRSCLLKDLKQLCGCGGVQKDSFLEIQGDQRDKILPFLDSRNLAAKNAGG